MNRPFFHKHKRAWYLQVGKKQVRLAENRDDATAAWHRLMAGETPSRGSVTVEDAFRNFLQDVKSNSADATFRWYRDLLAEFVAGLGGSRLAQSVLPYDVTAFMNRQKNWGPNTRHNFARACKRLFKWLHDQGLIESNPLAKMVKPRAEVRDDYVTESQFLTIMAKLGPGPFADLIVVAYDTGMRPQEMFALEARHVDGRRIVFPMKESKGKRSARVVYVGTERSAAILNRLCAEWPEGKLFRNSRGVAWNKCSVKCAFARVQKSTGIKTHLGAFRKGFCTEGLKNGVDTVTMSHLMGHASTVMVSRVYAKVHHDPEHMLAAASRARAARSQDSGTPSPETGSGDPPKS